MRGRQLHMTPYAAGILVGLSACGDDGGGPKVNVPRRDAGTEQDAGRDAQADADADAMSGDAGTRPMEEDAGPKEPFDPSQDCKLIEERSELSVPVMFGDESGFSVTPGLTGFGVVYQSDNCGAISMLPVSGTGEYPKPKTLFDTCEAVAQGVSLLHLGESYRLSWVDNSSGSAELQALQLSASLALPASPMRTTLTNNDTRELVPAQASIAGTGYLAWIDQDDDKREIMLQGSAESKPRTLITSTDYAPLRLALAQLGDNGGALGFVSEAKKRGVWLLPLTEKGEARGEPLLLTAAIGAGNTVDIATRVEDGGAVVYSLDIGGRQEVRFRRLNKLGALASDEVKVVTFPLQGRDASISRLGGGYVVAFRSVNAEDPSRGEVRIIFITKDGTLQRDSAGSVASFAIADASTTGGRVTARVSQDGHMLVGFLDTGATGDQGPRFRLIRKRFDCAL